MTTISFLSSTSALKDGCKNHLSKAKNHFCDHWNQISWLTTTHWVQVRNLNIYNPSSDKPWTSKKVKLNDLEHIIREVYRENVRRRLVNLNGFFCACYICFRKRFSKIQANHNLQILSLEQVKFYHLELVEAVDNDLNLNFFTHLSTKWPPFEFNFGLRRA